MLTTDGVVIRVAAAALAGAAFIVTAAAQERDRAKIADKYKWNLADIYPNQEAWRTAKDKLAGQIPYLNSLKKINYE
jgi:oligoendopeptidase F